MPLGMVIGVGYGVLDFGDRRREGVVLGVKTVLNAVPRRD